MNGLVFAIMMILVSIFVILGFGFALSRWYRRSTKEVAFVRTGRGGSKVVKDGGAFVLPILHELTPVNMRTVPINVSRIQGESLITKDKFRVDVGATFYVKVRDDNEGISAAAQTLGSRTMDTNGLKTVIEDKLVDALRSTAASMDMFQLHEERVNFVQQVQSAAGEDLGKNGLLLESVALTGLDQTDPKYLNPNNAFDAEGLKALAEITEKRREERNKIEAETRVNIEKKNKEAQVQSLSIAQEAEFATLEQEREVETRRAQQGAQLASERAEREREAKMVQIEAERATKEAEIARQLAVEAREIEKQKSLDIARQAQEIAVAEKSMERSKAQADAETARAVAVKAQQDVITAEETAIAERVKAIALLKAQERAEEEATRVRVAAEAEYQAAENRAKALERLTEAKAKELEVEAVGAREINEAANLLSAEQVDMRIRLELIRTLPSIIEQMVKPVEKVDSVRVVSMNGTGFGSTGGSAAGIEAKGSNLADQVTNAMLGYRMQLPIVDELAKQLGLDLSDVKSMVDGATKAHGKVIDNEDLAEDESND
jgi:uncharacterized membrane protein YqiK